MTEQILCGQCPWNYRPDQITMLLVGDQDEEVPAGTLADLSSGGSAGPRRGLRRLVGLPDKSIATSSGPDPRAIKAYTFKCPEGHIVDGNKGTQFPLALLGTSGASKTHVLPAAIRELDDNRALAKVGITLSDPLYPNPKLTQDVVALYRKGKKLPTTPPGKMLGPFGYKLRVGASPRDDDAEQYSLLLFDIAGEDLGSPVRIMEKAPYMVLCRGLLILIDPRGFLPTEFDATVALTDRARVDAARDVRGSIRVIAQTLSEVWKVNTSRKLEIPICFAVSKSDSVNWPTSFDWAAQTKHVVDAISDGTESRMALQASSNLARHALIAAGAELVVEEIEEQFNTRWVRYVTASATSAMPRDRDGDHDEEDGSAWESDPEPQGVALAILHTLDLAGALADADARRVAQAESRE